MSYVHFKDVDELIGSEFDIRKAVNWEVINRNNPFTQSPGIKHQYLLGCRKDGRSEIIPFVYGADRFYLNLNARLHDMYAVVASLQLAVPGAVVEIYHPVDTTPEGYTIDRQEFTNEHWMDILADEPPTYLFVRTDTWMSDTLVVLRDCRKKHVRVVVDGELTYGDTATINMLDRQGFVGRRNICVIQL
ncbi:hypothetical protein PHOBOS_242 [Erwinia phage vB_EamM_Phobos]|uniref:hypothetical protein n=1 Tax=Erwinia phage vB_EamM_Phobos TaxID=1883377 RepID=UPI00081D2EDA|nr:hypothetical protein BIZ79_gp242 [Erwinia phage vB_EamM_Phobos]ANZ50432.1 hypothetical protein PHOBOS_242 [Erwinia phage vB_EamM_Phobos]